MAQGFIKKLTGKHFGFIKTEDDEELFFHASSVRGVSFDELHESQEYPTRKNTDHEARTPRTSSRYSRVSVSWRTTHLVHCPKGGVDHNKSGWPAKGEGPIHRVLTAGSIGNMGSR